MKEIALYTLDIAQNSITAQARRLDIKSRAAGKSRKANGISRSPFRVR